MGEGNDTKLFNALDGRIRNTENQTSELRGDLITKLDNIASQMSSIQEGVATLSANETNTGLRLDSQAKDIRDLERRTSSNEIKTAQNTKLFQIMGGVGGVIFSALVLFLVEQI